MADLVLASALAGVLIVGERKPSGRPARAPTPARDGSSDRRPAGGLGRREAKVALPDFFVFGAPKAGTTALHAALARHPQLFMSPVKEPKFFLCDGPPPDHGGPGDAHSYREWIWRPDEYERLFDDAPPGNPAGREHARSTCRTSPPSERIRRAVPDARLVIVLRDPVDRAYSNWAHLWADGLETIGDFLTACAEEPRRAEAGLGAVLAATWAPGSTAASSAISTALFPRHQVHVIRYRALVDQPRTTARRGLPLPRRRGGAGRRGPGPERGRVRAAHALHPGAADRVPPGRRASAATSHPRCGARPACPCSGSSSAHPSTGPSWPRATGPS